MKILLLSDVDNLGWLGDIVDVKDGYARNYLIPHGLGTIPTDANIKGLAKEKVKRAEYRIAESKRLRKAADAVAGAEAVIAAKCNQQGRLFGSILPADIAKNLREQGFEVADEIVKISDHIKEIGTYTNVVLKFNFETKADITVVVVPTPDSDYVPPKAEPKVEADDSKAVRDSEKDLEAEKDLDSEAGSEAEEA